MEAEEAEEDKKDTPEGKKAAGDLVATGCLFCGCLAVPGGALFIFLVVVCL